MHTSSREYGCFGFVMPEDSGKGADYMQKNAVLLLIFLLCVAFLVSCGKKRTAESEQGQLVRIETEGRYPSVFIVCAFMRIDRPSYLFSMQTVYKTIP